MFGNYYKTIKRDEGTGETTFLLSPTEHCPYAKDGLLLCCGRIGIYVSGIPLYVSGEYKNGTYQVTECMIPNNTKEGSRRVLNSIADLTDKQIEKIIEACDGDVFQIFDHLDVLDHVYKTNGNKKRLIRTITSKLKYLKQHQELTRKLMNYGVPIDRIESLMKDDIDWNQLTQNPYLHCIYHDISIYTADQIACQEKKISALSEIRLNGFLIEAMKIAEKSGHTCQTPEGICRIMNWRLEKSAYPEIKINIALLNYIVSISKSVSFHLIQGRVYLYENKIWDEETSAIHHIAKIQKMTQPFIENIDVDAIEKSTGITYNTGQRAAFQLLKTSGIKILTGPPGSGKTAMIKGLIEHVKRSAPKKTIHLSATTGRASQVLGKSCVQESETVNKMLGVRPYGDSIFARNENNPIEEDFVIVDEISMLGIMLASILFGAIKPGGLLLLVGDEDQLQSVDSGNVLHDLIESGCIEVFRLTQVMRQSGLICENAKVVNQGITKLKEDKNFIIHHCTESEVYSLLASNMQNENCQIISSIKKGELGTFSLNHLIQSSKKLGEPCLTYHKTTYHVGEPVIMTETNYDKGYFNGDIGTIVGKEEDGILVDFSGLVIRLDRNDYHVMLLAYSITTHKGQGSEFDHVHIVLPRMPENMLTRRILYTAITRARKDVHIYDVDGACSFAISNSKEIPRLTLLKDRLKEKLIGEKE